MMSGARWRPPPEKERAARDTKITAAIETDRSQILAFPHSRGRCVSCGSLFAPVRKWHAYCAPCYEIGRAGAEILMAAMHLERARTARERR
jgi:hypothetical protein